MSPRDLESSCVRIQLTQGIAALVDQDDSDLAANKWYAQKDGNAFYARRKDRDARGRQVTIIMHREIAARMGIDIARNRIDHIDGNSLNNRRSNLRPATAAENGRNRGIQNNNTSGYKGVARLRGKWQALIAANGKRIYLGIFNSPDDAARAYDKAAMELHGKFARLNFSAADSKCTVSEKSIHPKCFRVAKYERSEP